MLSLPKGWSLSDVCSRLDGATDGFYNSFKLNYKSHPALPGLETERASAMKGEISPLPDQNTLSRMAEAGRGL